MIVDTGGLDELESHIARLAGRRPIAAIEVAEITDVAKHELVALAEYVRSAPGEPHQMTWPMIQTK